MDSASNQESRFFFFFWTNNLEKLQILNRVIIAANELLSNYQTVYVNTSLTITVQEKSLNRAFKTKNLVIFLSKYLSKRELCFDTAKRWQNTLRYRFSSWLVNLLIVSWFHYIRHRWNSTEKEIPKPPQLCISANDESENIRSRSFTCNCMDLAVYRVLLRTTNVVRKWSPRIDKRDITDLIDFTARDQNCAANR